MIWLQIVATVVVCGAVIADAVKNNYQDDKCNKTDCNFCAFLKQKNRWSSGLFNYYCKEHGGFDKSPIFCADYRKRNEVV